ncbi:MAG: RNA pseudouridine synthase [Chitinophagales bacterium]|nr:RNA pseudouridine synthase [Chitinophagales bacterium]
MKIEVIAETNKWIAVSKPAGIQVERNPFGPSAESLVYDYLSSKYHNPFVGVIHRIDRPTSGLVLMAKKPNTLKQLNRLFSQQEISKQYLARVDKSPKSKTGTLEHWLEKRLKEKMAWVHESEQAGAKRCQLEYEQLKTYDNGQVLLLIRPITGRYHQIRAQLTAIDCSIVGDEKYGSTLPYQPNSIMLHAWKMEIAELDLNLEADLPDWY